MARPGYFVEQTWGSLKSSWGLTIVTSLTIGVALVLVGVYWFTLQSIETLSLVWGRHAAVIVYAADSTVGPDASTTIGDIREALGALDGVAQVHIITQEEALSRFAAQGAAEAALVEGVPTTALPPSLEIVLRPGFSDAHDIAALAVQAQKLKGVEAVDYGEEDLADLEALLNALRRGGLLGGVLLLFATAFIVGNTIRLTVYSRRDEVAVLRLVGATPWFIRLPFVLEGAVWGALGAMAALLGFALLDVVFGPSIRVWLSERVGDTLAGAALLSPRVILLLALLGPSVGCVGSWFAVGRFIDEADA